MSYYEQEDIFDFIYDFLISENLDEQDVLNIMARVPIEEIIEVIELDEGFKDLTPEKRERVMKHIPKIVNKMHHHHDGAADEAQEILNRREGMTLKGRIKNALVGTEGPRRRGREHIKQYHKYKRHLSNAQDALAKTQASKMASITHKKNELKSKLRDLGVDPDASKNAKSNIRRFRREEFILEHLLDYGYADTYENAIEIYESMSDDWMMQILSEEF